MELELSIGPLCCCTPQGSLSTGPLAYDTTNQVSDTAEAARQKG